MSVYSMRHVSYESKSRAASRSWICRVVLPERRDAPTTIYYNPCLYSKDSVVPCLKCLLEILLFLLKS